MLCDLLVVAVDFVALRCLRLPERTTVLGVIRACGSSKRSSALQPASSWSIWGGRPAGASS
jgi:hypothetical protein